MWWEKQNFLEVAKFKLHIQKVRDLLISVISKNKKFDKGVDFKRLKTSTKFLKPTRFFRKNRTQQKKIRREKLNLLKYKSPARTA